MGELLHYGVLGMKWGVRKDGKPQGYQGGEAKKKKKRKPLSKKAKVGIGLAVAAGAAFVAAGTYNPDVYASTLFRNADTTGLIKYGKANFENIAKKDLHDSILSMPAKTVFSHISDKEIPSFRPGTYTTHDELDKNLYLNTWRSGSPQRFQTLFESTEKVKAPTLKEKVSVMSKVAESERQSLVNRQTTLRGKMWAKTVDKGKLGEYQYGKASGWDWTTGIGAKFVKELVDKGYSYMVDTTDLQGVSHYPTILLNPDNFNISGSRRISKQQEEAAGDMFEKLLENTKYKDTKRFYYG